MTQIKVFLDSSVIIAALASKKGGSFEVLALTELGIITAYISEGVVREVFRNVQRKLPAFIDDYYALIKTLPVRFVEATKEDLELAGTLINEKDAHVLAAAMSAKVNWLLSMDNHFLKADFRDKVGFIVGKPGDFLREFTFSLKDGSKSS